MGHETMEDIDMLRFLGNVPAASSEFIRQAAEETGVNVTVCSDARGIYRQTVPGHISVWTNEPYGRDHGPFWQAYRRLVDSAGTEG